MPLQTARMAIGCITLISIGDATFVDTQRVVVSAGTLGTNELLLRCRDVHGTLPRISRQLGQRFSGNGDFVSFAAVGKEGRRSELRSGDHPILRFQSVQGA